MNPTEYVKNAVVTESRDFEAIGKRMSKEYKLIKDSIEECLTVTTNEDFLKKHLFYGKDLNKIDSQKKVGMDSPENIQKRLSDPEIIRLLHGAFGTLTEAGELQQQLMNHIFFGDNLDKVNLAEEIGDTFWYLAILCDTLNVSFEEVMNKNIAKLKARFPNKFSEYNALNRDLETERKILEN